MKLLILSAGLLLAAFNGTAQDSLKTAKSTTVSGYAEIYYLYAFNKPANGQQPSFIYSHGRHNEVNLNLAFVKLTHTSTQVRANLALGAGTYMNDNYSSEPGTLKNIVEANAGIKLSKKKNLWLDAGILPSHIGFESATSKDCFVLTRSLVAETSPYFETGIRISYTSANEKWVLNGLLLNGWQRITRVPGQTKPNGGLQVQYKPNEKVLLNYSNFLGSVKPDSLHQGRFFHNLYGQFTLGKQTTLVLGFDIGTEKTISGTQRRYTWFSPVAILRQEFSSKWAGALRAEYYHDPHEVIIVTGTADGFRASGVSVNADFIPFKNVLLRTEARLWSATDAVFIKENRPVSLHPFICSSLAVSF